MHEAQKHAEQALENQSGEFDYSRAASQLAEATAQLRTLQPLCIKECEKMGIR